MIGEDQNLYRIASMTVEILTWATLVHDPKMANAMLARVGFRQNGIVISQVSKITGSTSRNLVMNNCISFESSSSNRCKEPLAARRAILIHKFMSRRLARQFTGSQLP